MPIIDPIKIPELRIVFDGVVAVGPPAEKDQKVDGPIFGVMARSTRRMSDRSRRLNEQPPIYIPIHIPTLYTTKKPAKGSRPPDEVYQPSAFSPEWYIWHPQRERMEFRFAGLTTPREIIYNHDSVFPEKHLDAGKIRLHPIDSVPHAREIWPHRAHLIEGMMAVPTAKAPVREEVAAQILVPRGEIHGGGIWDKEDGVEVVFDPPRASKKPRVVVPNVVVRVVDPKTVTIVMYSLDTGEELDPISFKIEENVDLWISNGDPSDTAIDLDNMGVAIANARLEQKAKQFLRKFNFDEELKLDARLVALKELLGIVITGSNPTKPPGTMDNEYLRSSDVDIDFELFYTLLEGHDDGHGLPVPKRPYGRHFAGPNCLTKVVSCRDRLYFVSDGE